MRTLSNELPVMSVFEIPAGLPEGHPLREFYDDRAYEVSGLLVVEIHQDGERTAYLYFSLVNEVMTCIAKDFEEEYHDSSIITDMHRVAESVHGGRIAIYQNESRVDADD